MGPMRARRFVYYICKGSKKPRQKASSILQRISFPTFAPKHPMRKATEKSKRGSLGPEPTEPKKKQKKSTHSLITYPFRTYRPSPLTNNPTQHQNINLPVTHLAISPALTFPRHLARLLANHRVPVVVHRQSLGHNALSRDALRHDALREAARRVEGRKSGEVLGQVRLAPTSSRVRRPRRTRLSDRRRRRGSRDGFALDLVDHRRSRSEDRGGREDAGLDGCVEGCVAFVSDELLGGLGFGEGGGEVVGRGFVLGGQRWGGGVVGVEAGVVREVGQESGARDHFTCRVRTGCGGARLARGWSGAGLLLAGSESLRVGDDDDGWGVLGGGQDVLGLDLSSESCEGGRTVVAFHVQVHCW